MTYSKAELEKLRWRSHRGMLELDIMLLGFFDNKFQNLAAEQQTLYIELLAEKDPDIFAWLLGHEQVKDEFAEIVQLIKEYHVTLQN